MSLELKYENLVSILKELKSVVVAYSGGVDSTYLMYVAAKVLGGNSLGVTGDFPASPEREIRNAVTVSEKFKFNHTILKLNPLIHTKVKHNVTDRCYYCKKEIFSSLIEFAEKKGFLHVIDGTNASDSPVERPGMRALNDLGIISPLRKAGITKNDIRELSKQANLPTWDIPSAPCLMTRFPFNKEVTEKDLFKVEKAEDMLKNMGFTDFRVRHYGKIARVELISEEMKKAISDEYRYQIIKALKSSGYEFVTIDLQGLNSGSMNSSGV